VKGGLVGVFAVVVLAYITFNTLRTEGLDPRGLERGSELPPFAVPLAASASEDQDANVNTVRQGDVPAACDVRGADVLNACALEEQGPFVLVFVVTEAGDCARQLDVLDRVAPRFPRVGFAAVAVREDLEDLQRRLRERGWRVPLGYDHDGAAANRYGLGAVCPLFTFADADGRVAATHVGVLSEEEIAARAERLAQGRPLP
jgi:AhpC/TSA family